MSEQKQEIEAVSDGHQEGQGSQSKVCQAATAAFLRHVVWHRIGVPALPAYWFWTAGVMVAGAALRFVGAVVDHWTNLGASYVYIALAMGCGVVGSSLLWKASRLHRDRTMRSGLSEPRL